MKIGQTIKTGSQVLVVVARGIRDNKRFVILRTYHA